MTYHFEKSWNERLRERRRRKYKSIGAARHAMERAIRLVWKKTTETEQNGMDIDTFEKWWLEAFGAEVSKEDMEKYVLNVKEGCVQYIWHVFSWGLISNGAYQVGDKARQAYMQADKEEAVFIEAFFDADAKSRPLPHMLKNFHMIDLLCTEIYVVAKDFSWTYIKTHEGDACGPYFCRKPQ